MLPFPMQCFRKHIRTLNESETANNARFTQ